MSEKKPRILGRAAGQKCGGGLGSQSRTCRSAANGRREQETTPIVATKLLEHAADFAEFGAELRAQARQDGDERDRDQRSDQRILDSRGARLVADERFEGIDQHNTCSILLTSKQIVPANFFRVNPIGEYAD